MDAAGLRSLAGRCRELAQGAVRDETREQLQQLAEDLDAEADALEKMADQPAPRQPGGGRIVAS